MRVGQHRETSDRAPDLAGRELYYAKSLGNYDTTSRIDIPSVLDYLIDNLVPATYHVAATYVSTAGIESTYSNEVEKNVARDWPVQESALN